MVPHVPLDSVIVQVLILPRMGIIGVGSIDSVPGLDV